MKHSALLLRQVRIAVAMGLAAAALILGMISSESTASEADHGTCSSHSGFDQEEISGTASKIEKMRALFAAINENRLADIIACVAAPNFERHDLTGSIPWVRGQQGALSFIDDLKSAFPDLRLEIADIFSANEKVVVRFVATGTHLGTYLGHKPTGKRIKVHNINIYRFEGDRVVETWQLSDGAGLLGQLGVLKHSLSGDRGQ